MSTASAPTIRVLCGWCGIHLSGQSGLVAGVEILVSHGICETCANRVMNEPCSGCEVCDSEPATSNPFVVTTNEEIERMERAR